MPLQMQKKNTRLATSRTFRTSPNFLRLQMSQSHPGCSARTSPFPPRVNEGGMVLHKDNVKLACSLLKLSKLEYFDSFIAANLVKFSQNVPDSHE